MDALSKFSTCHLEFKLAIRIRTRTRTRTEDFIVSHPQVRIRTRIGPTDCRAESTLAIP